jgi:hypothetical protein
MIDKIRWYFGTWWNIIARPIYFFTFMPEGPWKEDALTFAGATAWILSFALSIAIFVMQYIPIGLYLVDELSGLQKLLTFPVTVVFSFAFFIMTFLIVGGFVLGIVLSALFALGAVLHFALRLLGGKGKLFDTVKASFYSGAVFLFAPVSVCFMILAKFRIVEMWQLLAVQNMVYYMGSLYIYGLWSIAGRRVHDVARWKAFLAAVLPFLIVVLFGIVFHSKVFPKLQGYLM